MIFSFQEMIAMMHIQGSSQEVHMTNAASEGVCGNQRSQKPHLMFCLVTVITRIYHNIELSGRGPASMLSRLHEMRAQSVSIQSE